MEIMKAIMWEPIVLSLCILIVVLVYALAKARESMWNYVNAWCFLYNAIGHLKIHDQAALQRILDQSEEIACTGDCTDDDDDEGHND